MKMLISQSAVEYLALNRTSIFTQGFREHCRRGSRRNKPEDGEECHEMLSSGHHLVTELVNTNFTSSCGYLYSTYTRQGTSTLHHRWGGSSKVSPLPTGGLLTVDGSREMGVHFLHCLDAHIPLNHPQPMFLQTTLANSVGQCTETQSQGSSTLGRWVKKSGGIERG